MNTSGWGRKSSFYSVGGSSCRKVRPDAAKLCPICGNVRTRWAAHGKYCLVCEGKRTKERDNSDKAHIDVDRYLDSAIQKRKERAWAALKGKRRRAK